MDTAPAPAYTFLPLGKEAWLDMARNGRRLIEDYLPIRDISAEASREKSIRKGHISTLHLWWARRPLVACRAAIYAALVPADAFNPEVPLRNPPADAEGAAVIREDVARGLGRGIAGHFIKELCKYPGDPRKIEQAQQHILATHAAKLGDSVSVEDILEGRAPRPRVLDMFAGGGSIPLEGLRLGCEVHALELNPVAYLIELCTLVYPQSYGRPDKTVEGSAEDGTWAGLAKEVDHWGRKILDQVKAEIGYLYPSVADPKAKQTNTNQGSLWDSPGEAVSDCGRLTAVAYLWTRTVPCKNPACRAIVPLVRQTWLCKTKGRFVALKVTAPTGQKHVRFEVVEAKSAAGLGFDPAAFSKGGNATCPFCGTVADAKYVQAMGKAGSLGKQPMAVVCSRPGAKGKIYLAASDIDERLLPDEEQILERITNLCAEAELTIPNELINPLRPSPNARGFSGLTRYGIDNFGLLYTPRQQLLFLSLCKAVKSLTIPGNQGRVICSYLALLIGRMANQNCAFTVYDTTRETIAGPMGDKKVPMIWDFPETNPFSGFSGGSDNALGWIVAVCRTLGEMDRPAHVQRGNATVYKDRTAYFDAIVTDPPYYDNVPYADLSDFFYVWLKRSIGHLYPEHFASDLTPKKTEVTALSSRHNGDMEKARADYETKLQAALVRGNQALKPEGQVVIVYAHKTTEGWSTLVDAVRGAGFVLTEAWPMKTEMTGGKVKVDKAMLASSIFLVGSRRNGAATGSYEGQVRPELEQIVRERVDTLWKMGITGADLIIAAVGAGLRAFTQYQRVEYANGEEVPATHFLREVEGLVHDVLLEKIFSVANLRIAAVDSASRFYVLWRYTYKAAELDAGEAIVFTYGLDVELDNGLSTGNRALVQKKKNKYRLRDFAERGTEKKLGMPDDQGRPAPLVDVLHRILWLMENDPRALPRFLNDANPNREQLRLVANVLAGPGLKGAPEGQAAPLVTSTPAEQSALGKLLANWRNLMSGDTPLFDSP